MYTRDGKLFGEYIIGGGGGTIGQPTEKIYCAAGTACAPVLGWGGIFLGPEMAQGSRQHRHKFLGGGGNGGLGITVGRDRPERYTLRPAIISPSKAVDVFYAVLRVTLGV